MSNDKRSGNSILQERWSILWRGIRFRLRFLAFIGALVCLVSAWPWLRIAWERMFVGPMTYSSISAVSGNTEFFCPMDPGIVSSWPAICPICNMDLITRKKSDAEILPEGVLSRMQLTPYRIQMAGIRTVPIESAERNSNPQEKPNAFLVPVTSIVFRGSEKLVYIESMPGMFEGIAVETGPRFEDMIQVSGKIRAGQRVVSLGAFLLDAENRMNPNLSTQYFGASQQNALSMDPPKANRTLSAKTPRPELSNAERELVTNQKTCPVTLEPLGSMGTPVFVEVRGRKIAICCEGCRDQVLEKADEMLAWLEKTLAQRTQKP